MRDSARRPLPGRIRPARTVAALLGVALYAWLALGSGLDRLADQGDAANRATLWPFGTGRARADARAALTAGRPAAALAAAREAVRRDPFDAEATGLLGAAALASGDRAGAARVFAAAARLGWREPLAQDYLLSAALTRGDVHAAADHLDAILRQSPDLPVRNLLLAPLDATPAGRRELAARLALRPAWAQAYFADTALPGAGDPLARGEVAAALAKRGLADCALVAPLIGGLFQHGHYDQALATRLYHCEGLPKTPWGMPVDGNFALADPAHPPTVLDWRFSDDGAIAVRIAAGRRGERAVVVGNASSTTLPFAEQPMMLPPGLFRLNWTAQDTSGRGSAGIEAALTCDAMGSPWLRKHVTDGTNLHYEADVEIPPGCPRQRLVLGIVGGASEVTLRAVTLRINPDF